MKRRTSLDISDAESEAKFDASACDSVVDGVATSALMKLIRPLISSCNLRTFIKSATPQGFVFNVNHTDLLTQSSKFLY